MEKVVLSKGYEFELVPNAVSVSGEVISIKDSSGFENIDGWSRTEIEVDGKSFYVYYTNETLTVTSFKITFIFTEE